MRRFVLVALALAAVTASTAQAAPLTADGAVKIALEKSTSVVQANASVLSARGGMWSAYSGVLPRVSASYSRGAIGASPGFDYSYSGTGRISGSWSILSPGNIAAWSSEKRAMKSALLSRDDVRAQVVLDTKQQFYEVVRAMHLARVNAQGLKLARDDERRVRALYEVGSVSKSELLRARVRTSQAELDSLTADHSVTAQRIQLAEFIGIPEASLGDVDSTLTPGESATYVAADILADARAHRPDVRAAEAELSAAEWGVRASRLSRLPGITASAEWANYSYNSLGWDHTKGGTLALSMPVFDSNVESGSAASRARLLRARETRDALLRNLESQVELTLLAHQEYTERENLARRTVESASENLNLVQQKYNVGSATILDLIDAQVQYQRSQSDLVSAMATIRVAEAAVDKVRGRVPE
jgi:outer membrane protein